MANKTFIFQTRDRTFSICISSSLEGYTARVTEILYGNVRVPLVLVHLPRYEISPDQFYRSRLHYRGELVADIKNQLHVGPIERYRGSPHTDEIAKFDGYIRANLKGWPDGFPDAVHDQMEDWLD